MDRILIFFKFRGHAWPHELPRLYVVPFLIILIEIITY
jgi:hypothetical protein